VFAAENAGKALIFLWFLGETAGIGLAPQQGMNSGFHPQLTNHSDPGFSIGDVVIGVPPSRTLAGFPIERGCEEGLALDSLEAGTTITIQTINSLYHVTVVDGDRGEVLIEGGSHFPEATPAVLQGSSGGGSLLKTGWIGVGLHTEWRVDSRAVITSRVRAVTIHRSE
jgi:hypothetical protein